MQCVTPMFRSFLKADHSIGKVIPRSQVLKELNFDPNYIRHSLKQVNEGSKKYGIEQIPCQHCWACKLNYSAEWATRTMVECQKYEHNYFITLTYNDKYVPILEATEYDLVTKNKSTGKKTTEHVRNENDGTWGYSLYRKDVDRFINTLRKEFERKGHTGIKFLMCGEYGSKNQRPHYHLILMNCPLDIKKFYGTKIDENYKAHWKSKELENVWSESYKIDGKEIREPKGKIDVAEVEWSCIAYVARYCCKKIFKSRTDKQYYENGLMPEFIAMSNGIGNDYYEEHKDEIYRTDGLIMKTVKGNIGAVKPPKAWDRKFKAEDPEGFELIRQSRMKAKERSDALLQEITDYTDQEMLQIKARKVDTKMSMLPRQGEW